MSNSIAPGSLADVNVKVTALTTNPNVPVTYKTIILKKNLVNGVNTLTQEMMSAQNTKYVVKYDYVLGEDITVPAGCILEFDGGSISASGSNDTITGTNTGISAGLVNIFNTDVTLAGGWNVAEAYPEWFGAVGDGTTDDTISLRKVLQINFEKVVLSNKTYIINIESGNNNTEKRYFFEVNSKILEGRDSTIKLGSNNGNTTIYKGYVSILHYNTDYDIIISGIIFDFNYESNKIYQYTSDDVSVEQNGQQEAILFDHCGGVCTIRNCKFIEHSGTNCIDVYLGGNNDCGLNVYNCQFLEIGKESIYQGGPAYHDCSTIACHLEQNNTPSKKCFCNVHDNIAVGAGGNAFNFIETSADIITFENNYIEKYNHCILPLQAKPNSTVKISNNKFKTTGSCINMWNTNMDNVPFVSGNIGFDSVVISDNIIDIDIYYFLCRPNYNTLHSKTGIYYPYNKNGGSIRYNVVSIVDNVEINKSIGTLSFVNNVVTYKDTNSIPQEYVNLAYCNSLIRFGTTGELLATNDFYINELICSNNIIIDCIASLFYNILFPKINTFILNNNSLKNPLNKCNYNEKIGGLCSSVVSSRYTNLESTLNYVEVSNNITDVTGFSATATTGVFVNLESAVPYSIFKDGNVYRRRPLNTDVKFDSNGTPYDPNTGLTTDRPSVGLYEGYSFYDKTINKPIWWNGSSWVDATGATV